MVSVPGTAPCEGLESGGWIATSGACSLDSMGVNATPGIGPLRASRRAAGLSQQRLAELAGCSLTMIRVLESGYEPQNSDVMPRVAQVLNDAGPAGNGSGSRIADDGGDHVHRTR